MRPRGAKLRVHRRLRPRIQGRISATGRLGASDRFTIREEDSFRTTCKCLLTTDLSILAQSLQALRDANACGRELIRARENGYNLLDR